MRFLVTILVLCITFMARAEAPAAFVKLRDRSQPVESLTAFLERFVGSCSSLTESSATCMANARKARAELSGRLFYLILDTNSAQMLTAGPYNPATRQIRLDLTPFFEAGGLALTDGEPTGQDTHGQPRIQRMPLMVTLPDDWMPMDMERLLRSQNIRIHLVFKALGIWNMPNKSGGNKMEGVKAKFLAVRLTNARTGDEIALRVTGE